MKKLLTIVAFVVALGGAATAQERAPQLLWIGPDFGSDGTFGAGGNLEIGGRLIEGVYLNFALDAFFATNDYLLFGAGVKYYPTQSGLVIGLDGGIGDATYRGSDNWCFATDATIGYDFDWAVIGAKATAYLTPSSAYTFEVFVDLGGKTAALFLHAFGVGMAAAGAGASHSE